MKVCESCGLEIGTPDGDNECSECTAIKINLDAIWPDGLKYGDKRRAREDVLRSCGLVKVRGALGRTYWE